jgi:hypothetical protein
MSVVQMQGARPRKGRAQKGEELFGELRAELLMRELRPLILASDLSSESEAAGPA